MRKALSICVSILLSLCFATTVFAAGEPPVLGTEDPGKYADFSILSVRDEGTGAVLCNKEGTSQFTPVGGAVTWMTAIIASENLSPDESVEINNLDGLANNARKIGLQLGHKATVKDLLAAMLLYGAQDSAIALSAAVADSPEEFVQLMNEKAAQLGMDQTHYSNPTGAADAEQKTTAQDLLLLAQGVYNDPDLMGILSSKEYTASETSDAIANKKIENRCAMMSPNGASYDERITAAAIGYTAQEGSVSIFQAKSGDTTLSIIAVMQNPLESLYASLKPLMDYCFGFDKVDVSAYAKTLAEKTTIDTETAIVKSCQLADESLVFSAYPGFLSTFKSDDLHLEVDRSTIAGKIEPNQPIASAALYYQNTMLSDVSLLANLVETVEVQADNTPAPSMTPQASIAPPQPQQPQSKPNRMARYTWLVWPLIAGVLSLILILLSKLIRKRL